MTCFHRPIAQQLRLVGLALLGSLLAGCALPPFLSGAAEPAPQAIACPPELPATVKCLAGREKAGAFYLIAMPQDWNGHLVVHAHGSPALGDPSAKRLEDHLRRWAIVPRAGYAWVGSSYRQGGVAVRSAAEDTERVRGIFIRHVAKPKLTILHGQSWGASVAAKGAEMFTEGQPYDGVLLTSGVLAGGSRAYDFRLDLRVIYQHLCRNHPRVDETQYPLWMGLPEGSTMTVAELAYRIDECLGLGRPAAQRAPDQIERLKIILDVLRISERSLQGHLNWATFHFQDIARRSGGEPVFGNVGARYQGHPYAEALNAAVFRYTADPRAKARFSEDTDLTGLIPVPVLTVHGIHDSTAFVEMEHTFAQTMAAAGRADDLVQTFTNDSDHSYLSDATYVALLDSLREWIESGRKPTPQVVAEGCTKARATFPSECRFVPDYRPAPLETRVTPRRP